jgi:hypothetical protein
MTIRSSLCNLFTSGTHRTQRRKAAQRCGPCVEPLEGRLVLSTFNVTNTNDSGPGSLRAAILSVNADPNPKLADIEFTIDGTAPHTIHLASALPTITHPVRIIGFDSGSASSKVGLDG